MCEAKHGIGYLTTEQMNAFEREGRKRGESYEVEQLMQPLYPLGATVSRPRPVFSRYFFVKALRRQHDQRKFLKI